MNGQVIIIVRGVMASKDKIQSLRRDITERAVAEMEATSAGDTCPGIPVNVDALDRRSVAAGMEALDLLWEALPEEEETEELWAPYQHARYLLEQLYARVPEHTYDDRVRAARRIRDSWTPGE